MLASVAREPASIPCLLQAPVPSDSGPNESDSTTRPPRAPADRVARPLSTSSKTGLGGSQGRQRGPRKPLPSPWAVCSKSFSEPQSWDMFLSVLGGRGSAELTLPSTPTTLLKRHLSSSPSPASVSQDQSRARWALWPYNGPQTGLLVVGHRYCGSLADCLKAKVWAE